jgi:DNA-binding MarR family transcriptional regulator
VNAYETINDILVHLFNEIWELEEKAIITEEFKDISNNDMHIIEAVGLGSDSTMSMVARKLGITAGSLTTSVNSLVNKKYLVRERSESDRRVVYVRLTEKGRKAFFHHKDYHMQMTDAVVKSLDADEIPVLLKTLNSLSEFFRGYETKK